MDKGQNWVKAISTLELRKYSKARLTRLSKLPGVRGNYYADNTVFFDDRHDDLKGLILQLIPTSRKYKLGPTCTREKPSYKSI